MQKGQQNRNRGNDVSPRGGTPERTRPKNLRGGVSQKKGAAPRLDEEKAPSLISWAPGSRLDASVAPSTRCKKQLAIVDSTAVLFRIKNCIMQWKLVNKQVEIALSKRKEKAKTEVRCAALAVVQKQGFLTEQQVSLDKIKHQQRTTLIHQQLDHILASFGDIQDELKKKVEILRGAILSALEQIPLIDGAIIGDEGGPSGIEALNQCFGAAQTSLQQFSRLLNKFTVPLSRTPCSSRSPSPKRGAALLTTPLERLEASAKMGKQLEGMVQEEVILMKEIAELLETKHRKQLQLNSMKAYRAQVHARH